MTESEALQCHERGQQMQGEGLHAEAVVQFALAAEYFAVAEGEQSPDLANVLMDETESLLALCRYDEAEESARRAKDIVAAIEHLLDAETRAELAPRAYSNWGHALRELGRYEEAAEPLRTAVRESHPNALPSHLNNYGVLCKYWGKFDEGERNYLQALALLEERFGKESLQTATLYHNLGGLEHTRGNYAKGEPLGRKAYEIRRAALGEQDEATIADAVAWGGLLDGLERYSESIPLYNRALTYYEAKLGPDHFEVAATLNNLGMAQAALGNLEQAEATLQRCLNIKLTLFGARHPETNLTRNNLASIVAHRHAGATR
jgi:tetratricopeptide (TPR) repeat protein